MFKNFNGLRTASATKFLLESAQKTKFIYPVFVQEGIAKKKKAKLPGIYNYPVKELLKEVESCLRLGLNSFLVFGIAAKKGVEEAYKDGNIVSESIKSIKKEFGDAVTLFADVGLSPYTLDGHSVIVKNGQVNVKKTLETASKIARSYAESGIDFIAPCTSLRNQVWYLRKFLDAHGFKNTGIMAYSAKFASSFYGPYHKNVNSALSSFGGRELYHINSQDTNQAISQLVKDEKDGADIVMVKPALAYLDIIQKAKEAVNVPIAVYNVSGEYCMLKAAARLGWVDEFLGMKEIFTAFKRNGANIIISYSAKKLIASTKS